MPRISLLPLLIFMQPAMACASEAYFPPRYAQLTFTCPWNDGPEARPIEFLGKLEQDWFSSQLAAAKEPSLYAATLSGTPRRVIRFTWLRSFHPGITVRVEEDADHTWRVTAKQLSGAGGYEPGHVAKTANRKLDADEAEALVSLLGKEDLPDETGDCTIGMDGAQWIIERTDDQGYHFINRWSPSSGPLRKVGLFLLGLTHWNPRPIY